MDRSLLRGPYRHLSCLTLLAVLGILGPGASIANAAGPPIVSAAWVSGVFSSSARLNAEIDPNDLSTSYRFEYVTKAAFDVTGFTGAVRVPVPDAGIGSGAAVVVQGSLAGLQPDTSYVYRVVAGNSDPGSPTLGPAQSFNTFPASAGPLLPDGRGWELVSPVDKNGGQVDPPGTLAGGGLLQAAAAGGAVTYSSAGSFGEDADGAPTVSQYVSTRGTAGWSTQNITVPLFSGTYDAEAGGAPYRLFSGDLVRGLLLNGKGCRGDVSGCAVANPPLPGTDAPAGYQNYYLRESVGGDFEALLGTDDTSELSTDPADFALRFAGASPDLRHVVLSTCAALTSDAVDGCGAGEPNLYRWSAGNLSLLNLLPAQVQGAPGAELAAAGGAVSSDGNRIYWADLSGGSLYLREGTQTSQVDVDAGGGGNFETASADGSIAFFTKGGHLWRYSAAADAATDLTPSGGVTGVLGASLDGTDVYYQDGSGLQRWHDGTSTTVVSGAAAGDASNYPPATGTARVSADGSRLAFVSTAPLTGFDNADLDTKAPTSQVYLYDASADLLTCASCNPTNGRPLGPSSIPGAVENGTGPEATVVYKPRILSADGRRLFFDSADALVQSDTNNDDDVYQWEAQGTGSCARAGGCVALISDGRAAGGASFADASADGSNAFFLTDGSLVGADPGSVDLYDARIGGGFPEPVPPIPCNGDACQALPPDPVDPTLTTLLAGLGNPPERYKRYGKSRGRCRSGERLKTIRRKNGKSVKRCVDAKGRGDRRRLDQGGKR